VKQLALTLALMLVPALAAADTPDLIINGSGQPHQVDCGEGGKVTVNGARNSVSISGGCAKVTVNGSSNQVSIAGADKIVLNGSQNQVVYERGWTRKKPKISKRGRGNTISRRK